MRFSDPGYDTREPIFDSEYDGVEAPEPEQPYPPCEVCGRDSDGVTHYGHYFCSSACARCFDCEHRSGVACWYRMNMGQRAGHAWIKRVKHCPVGRTVKEYLTVQQTAKLGGSK